MPSAEKFTLSAKSWAPRNVITRHVTDDIELPVHGKASFLRQ